jgi:hypothetical protein
MYIFEMVISLTFVFPTIGADRIYIGFQVKFTQMIRIWDLGKKYSACVSWGFKNQWVEINYEIVFLYEK